MNKEEFWQTIESVNRLVPDGNQEMVSEKMREELLQHSRQDILDWYIIFHEYLNAAYRNDLRVACTALGAHASDDGFIDFRTWLISQGKKVYMDAMRDPDTLAQNPHPGVEMNFEDFTYCPVDAYGKKPSSGHERKLRLYDDLDGHKLSEQVIKDIREEIPRHKDISSNRLSADYSSLFPNIWKRMTEHQLGTRSFENDPDYCRHGIVRACVYQDSNCLEYRFAATPQNISNFVGSRPKAERIVLTDVLDRLLLDTRGNIIETCPDSELLAKVKHFLIPIQTGEIQAEPIRCECLTEQGEQQSEPGNELVTVHRMPDGTYQLYKTEVPNKLFEGAPANILEYLEYCDLAGVQERLPNLLVPADDYHLCILTKCDEDCYSIGVIWGAMHIADYIKQQSGPIASGELSELAQELLELPYHSPGQQSDFGMELPY